MEICIKPVYEGCDPIEGASVLSEFVNLYNEAVCIFNEHIDDANADWSMISDDEMIIADDQWKRQYDYFIAGYLNGLLDERFTTDRIWVFIDPEKDCNVCCKIKNKPGSKIYFVVA